MAPRRHWSPREMLRIENTGPIHRTDDQWRPGAEDDEAHRFKRVQDLGRRRNPATAKRVPQRRRDVRAERRNPQPSPLRSSGLGRRHRGAREERGGTAKKSGLEKTTTRNRRHGDV